MVCQIANRAVLWLNGKSWEVSDGTNTIW